jgi:hypothetical protein
MTYFPRTFQQTTIQSHNNDLKPKPFVEVRNVDIIAPPRTAISASNIAQSNPGEAEVKGESMAYNLISRRLLTSLLWSLEASRQMSLANLVPAFKTPGVATFRIRQYFPHIPIHIGEVEAIGAMLHDGRGDFLDTPNVPIPLYNGMSRIDLCVGSNVKTIVIEESHVGLLACRTLDDNDDLVAAHSCPKRYICHLNCLKTQHFLEKLPGSCNI